MKFCIDCSNFWGADGTHNEQCKYHLDIIDRTPLDCRACRIDDELCGKDGKNYNETYIGRDE